MTRFAWIEDGLPVRWGERPDAVPEGAVEVSAEVLAALPGLWFDGRDWRQRPMARQGATAEGLALADLPDGATVTVEDAETGEVLAEVGPDRDGRLDLSLPDPGVYEVTVTAPPPFLPLTARVTR